jgi:hypothetical protein
MSQNKGFAYFVFVMGLATSLVILFRAGGWFPASAMLLITLLAFGTVRYLNTNLAEGFGAGLLVGGVSAIGIFERFVTAGESRLWTALIALLMGSVVFSIVLVLVQFLRAK